MAPTRGKRAVAIRPKVKAAASSSLKNPGMKAIVRATNEENMISESTSAMKSVVTTSMKHGISPSVGTEPAQKRKKISVSDPVSASTLKLKTSINTPPSQTLDIYVFGEGDFGELGLGSRGGPAKIPRLNKLLDSSTIGVVQIAVGGMHCVALTRDQTILTWGVNDAGALGRDTTWEEQTRSDDEDEDELNPKESTPTAIPMESFGNAISGFAQVVATDSAGFALTVDGFVYGWGTFLGSSGKMGLIEEDALLPEKDRWRARPISIPRLKNIKHLAAGGNHVLALDHQGNVFSWGCGQQSQLGRRVMAGRAERRALTPCEFGLPRKQITYISCGAFHSFAIDKQGQVYTWGLNNFGQTGMPIEDTEEGSIVEKTTIVPSLKAFQIREIDGGTHHSIACTTDGKLLVWGRCDDFQLGVRTKDLNQKNIIFDSRGRARIHPQPMVIPDIVAASVAAGTDNSLAITINGEAYSWGFSANYRTGLGTQKSVEVATPLRNEVLLGKMLTFAACGGQFSVLAGPARLSNGVS